jgi:hypothetical protein
VCARQLIRLVLPAGLPQNRRARIEFALARGRNGCALHFNYKTKGVRLKSNLSSGMIHSVSQSRFFSTGGGKFFVLNCFSDFNLLWQWNGLCSKASNQTWHESAIGKADIYRRSPLAECVCKLGDTTFAHCCGDGAGKRAAYSDAP